MATFEVEVVGHFGAIVTVEADSYEEAESLALRDFEYDYKPYSSVNSWTDAWSATDIESVINLDEEDEED